MSVRSVPEPQLTQLEVAGLGPCVEDRLQPFARDRLCQGFPKQLILDAQAGGDIGPPVQGVVDGALGAGDGLDRMRRDAGGQVVDESP